jgi:hypothetical protein
VNVQPHYVKRNEGSRVPRRWVYFDTEANIVTDGRTQRQTWRLGVTCFEHRDNAKKRWTEPEWCEWTDARSLWEYVSHCTHKRARTVVMAHNLAYDLRLSNALTILPKLGWRIDLMSIGGRNLTMTLKRDGATLVLTDSHSWLPHKLEAVGVMVKLPKGPLPKATATERVWLDYCKRDVEILREANRELLAWLDEGDLGNWQKTGAGMAWSNWRHRHYTDRVLVHADPFARTAEVAAVATGRCEAWQHGGLNGGGWREWDLPHAYATVCLDTVLPAHLLGHVDEPTLEQALGGSVAHRWLLRARVSSSVPTLPVRSGKAILWPVGAFEGWWWDHELELAISEGADVEFLEGFFYRGAPALRDWAQWVIAVSTDTTGAYTDVQQAAAKHWSRALIGRFGAKFPRWLNFAPADPDAVDLHALYDYDTGRLGHLLTIGGVTYVGLEEDYVADANPAIMGAVVSECRVRLWQLMRVAGLEHVAYVDTDSLIVDRTGHRRLDAFVRDGGGWGLRVKGTYDHLDVLGPRQLVVNGRGRIAGVPKGAVQVRPNVWAGTKWDGMTTTLATQELDVVRVRETEWKVRGVDHRRAHLRGHKTAALELMLGGHPLTES